MAQSGNPRGKGCIAFLTIVVVLGVLSGLGFTLWQRTQDDALRERWKTRGLPTSLAEFDEWYEQVPDEENAALGFVAAADVMIIGPVDKPIPLFSSNVIAAAPFPMDEATSAATSEYLTLDENVEALSLAYAAAKLPGSRYAIDLSIAPLTNTDHLSSMRSVARLLWLDALAAAQTGNPDRAVESFCVADALARSLSSEPLLISQLVSFAIAQATAEYVCTALTATQFSREDLIALEAVTAWPDAADAYYRGLAGESVLGLFSMTQGNGPLSAVLTFDRHRYGSFLEALIDTKELPLSEAAARVESMAERPSQRAQRWFPLSASMRRSIALSHKAFVRSVVLRDLLKLVIAIERYRLDHGTIPDDASQLVPGYLSGLPRDPYSVNTISYFRENPGYAVYSVGPDRADDQAAKLTGTAGDIALHVRR